MQSARSSKTFCSKMMEIESHIISQTPSGLCQIIDNRNLTKVFVAFANSVCFTKIHSLAEAIIIMGFNTSKAFVIDELTKSSDFLTFN